MISEGQRNDINYAIPLLDHIEIDGSKVLADRGYDSNQLIDYIYDHGGEPTIPSRRGAKFERRCDWWFYKERHLVENYFLKLKAFRRIATRYDKLAFTYLGFLCIVSILIYLNYQLEIYLYLCIYAGVVISFAFLCNTLSLMEIFHYFSLK